MSKINPKRTKSEFGIKVGKENAANKELDTAPTQQKLNKNK
jgi:hypothetical protein